MLHACTRGLFKLGSARKSPQPHVFACKRSLEQAEMEKALDEEFKSTVTEMKPHAKKLPQKSSEDGVHSN